MKSSGQMAYFGSSIFGLQHRFATEIGNRGSEAQLEGCNPPMSVLYCLLKISK